MNDKNHAYEQAQAQMSSIREMVAALECDYDRLEELREERADSELASKVLAERHSDGTIKLSGDWWEEQYPDEAEELAALEEAAGDCEDRDDAEQRIQEDALSVEVRSGWADSATDMQAEEFRIVLCTGGPHVQMRGELDEHGEPSRAWLEYQDWGTPMTKRVNKLGDMETLLTYARCFYFCD